jgi:transcriptional regulator with XRE-family HTH domain
VALGPLLKRLRQDLGLTQRQLGQLAGVRQALISELESGKKLDTQGYILQRLARVLGVTVDELLATEDPQEEVIATPHM